jgi:protein TonB
VVAPVPRPRPDRPEPVQEPQQKPAATPQQNPAVPPAKKPPPARKRQATIPSNAGNEGNADTEAQAGRQAGAAGKSQEAGQAEVSRYEGQVQRKVARALRFPSGARDQGVAQVQFVVAASGAVSQVRVVRSAGSAALDSAAIEAVQRAAPFPPIPAAAGRSSWTFAMPLTFKR